MLQKKKILQYTRQPHTTKNVNSIEVERSCHFKPYSQSWYMYMYLHSLNEENLWLSSIIRRIPEIKNYIEKLHMILLRNLYSIQFSFKIDIIESLCLAINKSKFLHWVNKQEKWHNKAIY